jgi:hypothetical protein
MMKEAMKEAIILTYLEWMRLIGRGWIRIDEDRVKKYDGEKESNYTDLICELMRKVPDVGMSATDFIFTKLQPAVLERYRSESGLLDLGHRLTLSTVEGFYSFTKNALIVHQHDAQERNCSILQLAPQTMGEAWGVWNKTAAAIGAGLRSTAFLSRFGLQMSPRTKRLIGISSAIESIVEHETIARTQDTMCYGWSYVLNAIKIKFLENKSKLELPSEVIAEIKSLRVNEKTEQPFLKLAPKILYFLKDVLKDLPSSNESPSINDYLAIATLKQYERYLVKHEGSDINHTCFEADVQHLFSLDQDAAAFLVSEMGVRLPDGAILSLEKRQKVILQPQETPVEQSAVVIQEPERESESEPTQNIKPIEHCPAEISMPSSENEFPATVMHQQEEPEQDGEITDGDQAGTASASMDLSENGLPDTPESMEQSRDQLVSIPSENINSVELIPFSHCMNSSSNLFNFENKEMFGPEISELVAQSQQNLITQIDNETVEIDYIQKLKNIKNWRCHVDQEFLVNLINEGKLSKDQAASLSKQKISTIQTWREKFSKKNQT